MTDPYGAPGHGPADPFGYLIEETAGGYCWTCLGDDRAGGPFPTRHDAVHAAEHASFLGAALLFWSVVLGSGERQRGLDEYRRHAADIDEAVKAAPSGAK